MTNSSSSLWEALLRPPEHGCVPLAGTREWRARSLALDGRLQAEGWNRRIRSPAALWALLHGGSIPAGSTWGRLVAGQTVDSLIQALGRERQCAPFGIVSWNVNWLRSTDGGQSDSKRNCVRRWLDKGKAVLLQETHWNATDVGVWTSHLPAARVLASPAVQDRGGVAIVLPP